MQNIKQRERSYSAGLQAEVPVGYLSNELPILYCYLGDIVFSKMVRDMDIQNPNKELKARFFLDNLCDFLKDYHPFQHSPEVSELAKLELSQNRAFRAPEEKILKTNQLTNMPTDDVLSLKLKLVASAQTLTFYQNTTSIWAALKCEERPPKPHLLDSPQQVLVWRQKGVPRFRLLGEEEAQYLDHCSNLAQSAGYKSKKSDLDHDQTLKDRLVDYVLGWATAELLLCRAD